MRAVIRLALLVALASSVSAQDLAGLWKAKRRFGPDARGTLIVERTGNAWSADFAGHTVPVRFDNGHLSFELPDDAGRFAAKIERERITGHWVTPKSETNGNRYACPVNLARTSEGRWQGIVKPRDDDFTFYLLIQKRPDGTLGAWLRNPERNVGVNYNADRIVIDGEKVRLIGKWNGRRDERDLATGTYNADDGVISLWLRGATYDFTRDDAAESDFNARPAAARHYVYRKPLVRDDGWPVTSLDEAGIDRGAIERVVQAIIDTPVDSVHAQAIDGLLIARHGKLVLEEYFRGEHRDKLHDTRSAAKVIPSVLAGVAIHDRKLTVDTHLAGDSDARKSAITLEHLLTMRAGFFCDDNNDNAPGNEQKILDEQKDPDYIHYSLNVPMASVPGGPPVYCSMMPNLALAMASKAENEPGFVLFDERVARPMKITSYAWPLDPAGNAYGGGGVQLTLRDFAKLPQLLLNGGTWAGKRLLDSDYAQRASSPLVDFNKIQYGYLWWNREYPYKQRKVRAFFASGNGGQLAMAIPDLDLVIAVFSSNYADRVAVKVEQEFVPQLILPAIQ